MKQQVVYNLEEFATKYHLNDIFGAYAAHFSIGAAYSSIEIDATAPTNTDFYAMVQERTLFTNLLLVKQGQCQLQLHADTNAEIQHLSAHHLLLVTPQEIATLVDVSPDFEAECCLVDELIAKQPGCYQLPDEKYQSVLDIFHFVRDIVRHQHINKIEMIKSMFNVLKLLLEELPYEECSISHDLGHKKEVYEIFLHHLYRNFRKERQIRFYADKLNVSSPYLMRLVRDISGSTVNEHVTSLLYKEICNLLSHSDMTIGEIATHLNFSDQSALTNFFKQRSGMTPLAYRNKKVKIRPCPKSFLRLRFLFLSYKTKPAGIILNLFWMLPAGYLLPSLLRALKK